MNDALFSIAERDGAARCGRLALPHGALSTPAFMPVGTAAAVKAASHRLVDELGYRLILANTYHLYLRPGGEVIKEAGGLHRFCSWPHNILTDSGGFQVFSLAKLRKITPDGVRFQSHIDGSRHLFTPENVVGFQALLGSDIQMVLDVCTGYGADFRESQQAVELTTAWAKRAVKRRAELMDEKPDYNGLLFPIVQGNFFKDLRKRSAEEITALKPRGIAIGGLSVGEPPGLMEEFLAHTAALLPQEIPRYVMGIGTPDYIFAAVDAGIDMFDCVYPTRVARNGCCMTRRGLISLKQAQYRLDFSPVDPDCSCPVCRRYTRAYLRHLYRCNEILALNLATEHNLHFMAALMNDIRESIREGRFAAFRREFCGQYYKEREKRDV